MSSIVVVHGSYYAWNFGDVLLIRMVCSELALKYGRENVFLATEGHDKAQRVIGFPVLRRDSRRYVSKLVLAGGGYFGEPNGSYFSRIRWSLQFIKNHFFTISQYRRAKIYAFGLGFGPLSSLLLRRLLKSQMSKFEKIYVRDRESYDFMVAYGFETSMVKVTSDLALSLERNINCEKFELNTVVLHCNKLSNPEFKVIEEFLMLSRDRFNDVILLSDNSLRIDSIERIVTLTEKLSDIGFSIKHVNFESLQDVITSLSGKGLIITDKLHVGIVGNALSSRVVSIPSHHKTPRFYRDIGKIEQCINKEDLTLALLNRAVLASQNVSDTELDGAKQRSKITLELLQKV